VQLRIARLAERVLAGERLDRSDARYLCGVGGDDIYDLFYWANKIRIRYMGRDVKFCAIVAAKVGGAARTASSARNPSITTARPRNSRSSR
jgi:biotin synthase